MIMIAHGYPPPGLVYGIFFTCLIVIILLIAFVVFIVNLFLKKQKNQDYEKDGKKNKP